MSRRSTNRLLPSGKGDIKIGRLMRTTGEKEDNGALSKSCQLENFVQIGWWIMNDPSGQHTYREFQPTWREWWSIYEAPAARLTFIDKFPKLTAFYPTDGQPFAKKSPALQFQRENPRVILLHATLIWYRGALLPIPIVVSIRSFDQQSR